MSEALLTIGITCFNEGPLLREAWESVLAQECDEWEAVAVLDGEVHPETVEVFRSVEHPRLRKIINPRNLGPYPTKARAIEATKTPYFLFLDGDDLLPPNAVGDVVNCLRKDPVDFVSGDWLHVGEGEGLPHRIQGHVPTAESVIEKRLWPCVTCWSREIFFRVGGYPQELARGRADRDFVFSLIEHGARGAYLNSVLYRYRARSQDSVSKLYAHRVFDIAELLVARHPGLFGDSKRRRSFVLPQLAEQAWTLYWQGNRESAAKTASRAKDYGGLSWVWPLQYGETLSCQTMRFLVFLRKLAAHAFHWPIVTWKYS